MNILPVPICTPGFDTDTSLNSTSASRLRAAGGGFVVRYLGGVDAGEARIIISSGLGLQIVTFSRSPGWIPTAAMGTQDGAADVARLRALGVPAGMLLWIDLEGSGGDAASTAAWVNARAAVLVGAGYLAGVYVGAGCVLNGSELYALPNVTHYWKAFNLGIPEPECGFCQAQLCPPDTMVGGVEVDFDVSYQDFKGRVPLMLVA